MTDKPANNPGDHHALLKQAVLALGQMQQKLAEAEQRARQPIAIIGMGCRFPGQSDDLDSFWDLLTSGRDAIREVPAERWNIDDFYDPDPATPGKMVSRYGGFLDQVDLFDAAFFGIAPREAAMMDPQQRLLLEVTWQALEDAAIAPRILTQSRTGIYIGMASGDYAQLQLQAGQLAGSADLLDVHYASGNAHSIASGRLAYLLGLKGPCLSVDTACSSSLVAVHLACQALRSGDCSMAIAGGVNVILAAETTVALSQAHMLAPDGRCKVFDERADGFTRAEGCGIVILKPLAQALQDGDRIHAVLRGTAVNQDGASSSLTAPHGPSQEELMHRALQDAGIPPARVGYLETHGTGTSLGDPIELRALGSVYGAARQVDDPIYVGSLKTNVGHMEAAAGVGGLIKLVLSLKHGQIPAHLQFETPTTHVPWQALKLAVPIQATPWQINHAPSGEALPRIGGVSSFGFSGTNAHLLVEESTTTPPAKEAGHQDPLRLFPVSAQTDTALRSLAQRLAQWLIAPATASVPWTDVAATASIGRNHYRYRFAVTASSTEEAAGLIKAAADQPPPRTPARVSSLCFLFTGQGSERTWMGLDLLARSEVFRRSIERLDHAAAGLLDCSIQSIWSNHSNQLAHARYVQPALYAYGWALSELWRSFGFEPQAVLGHSLGEYVAATVAGVMRPEDGMRLVIARGRLTEELAAPSAMIAVSASAEQVRRLFADPRWQDALSIAAINGRNRVVVSGAIEAIAWLEDRLRSESLRSKRLRTTHGFHSSSLDPMLDAFEAEAARIDYQPAQMRWVSNPPSNLDGRPIDSRRPIDAQYWRRQLRHTVHFSDCLTSVEALSPTYLEIGAEPQLLALAEDHGIPRDRLVSSIRKSGSQGEWHKTLSAAAELYARGFDLDWKGIHQQRRFQKVALPGCPFERKRFWFSDHSAESKPNPNPKQAQSSTASRSNQTHPLLTTRVRTRSASAIFQAELTPSHPSHLGDHSVMGKRILPGSSYLEMAIAAAIHATGRPRWRVAEVELREACGFDQSRLIETVIHEEQDQQSGRRQFTIASTSFDPQTDDLDQGASQEANREWTVHATGLLQPINNEPKGPDRVDLTAIRSRLTTEWDQASFYERFHTAGLDFGPAFRTVQHAYGTQDESLVAISVLPETSQEQPAYQIHPIVLDACLQAAAAFTGNAQTGRPALPVAMDSFELYASPANLRYAHAQVNSRKDRLVKVTVTGLDETGVILLKVEGLALLSLEEEPDQWSKTKFHNWLHTIEWQPCDRLGSLAGSDQLPHLQPLSINASQMQTRFRELAIKHDIRSFDRWMRDFNQLCAAWIVDAFERTGVRFDAGQSFNRSQLLSSLAAAQQHHQLVDRLIQILTESGYLQVMGEGLYNATGRPRIDVLLTASELARAGHPELAWTEHTAAHMLPLLRGEINPVDILFSEQGARMAARLYRESVSARIFNGTLVQAAVQAASQCPGGARVLEVGGGTAASTNYLLPALDGLIESYVWTDLGPSFVKAARREFGERALIEFQSLDLERDPMEQGLDPQSFDIVIASNVFHATSDLRKTIAHVRSLLRPGGVLLLAETVDKQPWIDLTVGFTSGWWCFNDRNLRPAYPLISKRAWLELLSQSGFDQCAGFPDHADGVQGQQSVMTAALAAYPQSSDRVLIVSSAIDSAFPKPANLVSALALRAKSSGIDAVVASINEDASKVVAAFFSPNHRADATVPGRTDIYLLAAAELIPNTDNHDPIAWQSKVLGAALRWTQALITQNRLDQCRLWLITRGAFGPKVQTPDGATLAGFARSVQSEYPEAHLAAIDLDPANPDLDAAAGHLWRLRPAAGEGMLQYALRHDQLLIPRLKTYHLSKPSSPPHADHGNGSSTRRLHYSPDSGIDGLKPMWEARQSPSTGEIEITITAAAINFHEVLSAIHGGDSHVAPGGECAGVVERVGSGVTGFIPGDPVVALGSGLMADFATMNQDRIWKKPPSLTAAASATVLIPFLTARWSLATIAKLKPGERILIHAAAGGVGLAAVQEAHRLGAIVFATAGTEQKRAHLRGLGVAAAFDSRSTRFAEEVQVATASRGVDVVLNSLNSNKIQAGLSILAPGGRFIELGELGILTADEVTAIRPDIAYHPVHLRQALEAVTPEVRAIVDSVLADLASGVLQPLPHTSFPLDQASSAFRFMAAGRHIGRVLLEPRPAPRPESRPEFRPESRTVTRRDLDAAHPRFRADAAYVVTGGLGGLGKLTVEWLIQHGAGCVLALGRSAPHAEIEAAFAQLRQTGAQILCHRCDVSDALALQLALRTIPAEFPLRGVIHSAGVLADAAVVELTAEKLYSVLSAKVAGAWNLHQATLTADLDFFILYASAAGVLGSRGQANHAAANAYLDALAHYRRGLGLTALSVDWGAWSGSGAAVRHAVFSRGKLAGVRSIPPQDGLAILGQLLQSDLTQVLASPVDWPGWAGNAQAEAAANRNLLADVLRPSVKPSHSEPILPRPSDTKLPRLNHPPFLRAELVWRVTLLATAEPQRCAHLETLVEDRIRTVLAMPATQSIESDRPLQEYGLDSLLSIELRNLLSNDVGEKLPATTLFDYPTLRSLTGWLFRDVLKLGKQEALTPQDTNLSIGQDLFSGVSSLSEEEVERRFQQRMAGIRD